MKKPWAKVMEVPWVYRLWQAPFAEQKLAPLWRHNRRQDVRRVLDVGCGPGTNAPHFRDHEYLGLDINPEYVAQARARYGMDFRVADVTGWRVREHAYDFILVNSFFHHVGDQDADRILAHLLDLVLPDRPSPSHLLARLDRGDHPRPLAAWRELLGRHFEERVFEPYDLGVPGLPLWRMVYFKGGPAA